MSTENPVAPERTIAAAIAALGLDRPSITELAGGAANRTFRLRDRQHDFVLRLAGEAAPGLGANSRSEFAMQSLAAGAGLAPSIVLMDPVRGFVVSRHAEGRMPTAAEFKTPWLLRRIGEWIARLHALTPPPGLPVVDFGERAAGYLKLVAARSPDAFIEKLLHALELRRAALPPPTSLTACHHDLHHRNFLDDGGRLVAVDWEYAGPGDAAADVASCIGYHALDAAGIDALLEGYATDSVEFRARIEALGWIFDCLWFGWIAAAALAGLATDPEEQSRLAARLAR